MNETPNHLILKTDWTLTIPGHLILTTGSVPIGHLSAMPNSFPEKSLLVTPSPFPHSAKLIFKIEKTLH